MKNFLFTISLASIIPFACYAQPSSNDEPPSVTSLNIEPENSIVFADQFPEVIEVSVDASRNNSWRFNVTLSSTYDTPQRYADAWRVLDAQGNELGIRILGHDHANEQPFTRSKQIKVPDNVQTVYVEGRDQANGWSGQRFEVKLPTR